MGQIDDGWVCEYQIDEGWVWYQIDEGWVCEYQIDEGWREGSDVMYRNACFLLPGS